MAPSVTPVDGETFVSGRSASKSRELIAKAKKLGVDTDLIRTTGFGYIVPVEVAEADATLEDVEAPADTDSSASDVADHKDETAKGSAPRAEAPGTGPDDLGTNPFDPSEHTVLEVEQYLSNADDEETARVLEAETNGKARKGLLPETEGE